MIEVVFDARPQTVHYHNGMCIAQLPDPIDLGNAQAVFQQAIQLRFLCNLWMF